MHIGQEHIINEQYSAEEVDHFQLLEEKIDRLIRLVNSLKEEKERMENRLKEQDATIDELRQQVEELQADKDRAKERIKNVLDKIDQLDIEGAGE